MVGKSASLKDGDCANELECNERSSQAVLRVDSCQMPRCCHGNCKVYEQAIFKTVSQSGEACAQTIQFVNYLQVKHPAMGVVLLNHG